MDYTKGEWTVWWRDPDDKGDSDCRIVADGEDVAIILASDPNECEANAHLISAAKEMYEALEEIREVLSVYKDTFPQVPRLAIKVKCDDALAKAEGE